MSPLQSLLVYALFIVSWILFSSLPGKIVALHKNDHFVSRYAFSRGVPIISILFVLIAFISSIYAQSVGFETIIFSLIIVVTVMRILKVRSIKKSFSDKGFDEPVYSSIAYGLDDCAKEINEVQEKYKNIYIEKSVSNSPMYIIVCSEEGKTSNQILEEINNLTIFQDLSDSKYIYIKYLLISLFTLSTLYMLLSPVAIILWELLQL